MNIGKSIKICLAKTDMERQELAGVISVTPTYVTKLCNQESCSSTMLEKLCVAFEMKASEFIALGESE